SQVVYEKVKYYLVKDGVPYLIRKKNDLMKLYREDRKRLNSAMDSLGDSVADKDEFYARVGAFIDNI
ncbi:MAG: hypothetical protein IKW15_01585, partial [Bacteroidales bacterium]|nr:hypothetical protein [Bacteroidales bacterium]